MKNCLVVLFATWPIIAAAQPCDIKPRVCSLQENFIAEPGPNYASPTCENPDRATDKQKERIVEAFKLAPPKLQEDLCGLKQIFIIRDADGRHSWGKWEDPDFALRSHPRARKPRGPRPGVKGTGNAFIAVHVNALDRPLFVQQNEQLRLAPLSIPAGVADYEETGISASESVSLLFVLAHEMAHIKWRRDHKTFTCTQDDFVRKSWARAGDATSQRWVGFGTVIPGQQRKAGIPNPRRANAAALNAIYRQRGLATALATANPIEDFVESYSMQAIMLASPTGELKIRITGHDPVRVNSDRGNQDLKDKFGCVRPLLM